MKYLFTPIFAIVIMIICFVVVEDKELNRHGDIQSVQSEVIESDQYSTSGFKSNEIPFFKKDENQKKEVEEDVQIIEDNAAQTDSVSESDQSKQ